MERSVSVTPLDARRLAAANGACAVTSDETKTKQQPVWRRSQKRTAASNHRQEIGRSERLRLHTVAWFKLKTSRFDFRDYSQRRGRPRMRVWRHRRSVTSSCWAASAKWSSRKWKCHVTLRRVGWRRRPSHLATRRSVSPTYCDRQRPPPAAGQRQVNNSIYIIQVMHGSEWTLKYDEPEVENVARTTVFRMFVCFVVWPTTGLYIVFWDGSETRDDIAIVCHLKMHTDLITVRG